MSPDSITIEVKENPSPSGDTWFNNPENINSIETGIAEMKACEGRAYTLAEIKSSLGI